MFKWLRREDGQSYLELALVLPFLVLLLLGTLDVGRAFNAQIVVMNAAREGARYGIAHSGDTSDIQAKTLQATTGTGVTVSAADVTITYPNGQVSGKPIRVRVTHNFQFLVGMIFGTNSLAVTAAAEMEIIQ
jgi:Flp pilus assembly protein TadG